jgi:hypothetical protein
MGSEEAHSAGGGFLEVEETSQERPREGFTLREAQANQEGAVRAHPWIYKFRDRSDGRGAMKEDVVDFPPREHPLPDDIVGGLTQRIRAVERTPGPTCLQSREDPTAGTGKVFVEIAAYKTHAGVSTADMPGDEGTSSIPIR